MTEDAITRMHITENPLDDPGDIYDKGKWVFSDNDLISYNMDDGYLYKINDTGSSTKNLKQVSRLVKIREGIDQLCFRVLDFYKTNNNNIDPEFANGILIFLDIHGTVRRTNKDSIYFTKNFNKRLKSFQNISSKYLLSELPINNDVAGQFIGLDVPKMRYIAKGEPFVGPDKNIRASYRDIYLNKDISGIKLKNLILHELSHTIANHCLYRINDHHEDFKRAESFLKYLSEDINFS